VRKAGKQLLQNVAFQSEVELVSLVEVFVNFKQDFVLQNVVVLLQTLGQLLYKAVKAVRDSVTYRI
jgi:hypothetical protein